MRPVVLLLPALPLVLAACPFGGPSTVDKAHVEQSIRSGFAAKGVTLRSIECPQGMPLVPGSTFNCTVRDEAESATVMVTVKDRTGAVDWKLDGEVLDLMKVGDNLEQQIQAKTGKHVDVQCPSKSIILKSGRRFTCNATNDGKQEKIDIVLTDNQGSSHWELHP